MTSNFKVEDTSPKRSVRIRSKRSLQADDDEDTGSSIMSLDVLARVASETLKQEPRSPKKKVQKKIPLRAVSNIDVLTLDQILGLTEKTIIHLFTEMKCNEMSRTFTYTCQLIAHCHAKFTSFGSEMRARADVKKHLYEHLEQLEKDAAAGKPQFMAETFPAKKRKLLLKYGSPKRMPSKKTKQALSDLAKPKESEQKAKKKSKENYMNSIDSSCERRAGIGFIPVPEKMETHAVSRDVLQNKAPSGQNVTADTDSEDESDKRIEENEQFIIELLSKTHPHHDHSYTTIFGRRKNSEYVLRMLAKYDHEQGDGVEKIDANASKKEVSPSESAITSPKSASKSSSSVKKVTFYTDPSSSTDGKTKKTTPILFLRHRSPDENVPMVSKEEIINEGASSSEETESEAKAESDKSVSCGEKPYPPMPKSNLARRGRLGFDISDMSDGSDDDRINITKVKVNPLGREGREGNLGWEPKLAMKFIKELKGRKKGDVIPLKCKICNDKTFTAAATLLYHYRSHAGFKPFVCLICNTTFTRQHSLNYHMLIHNNQSRFTCKDCGRKFRHPSHFKEHLRRHTGETPFECKDCGQKFKTRNTYKRHLKTRHGKLLTASGIHAMTVEEFAKVRTKRYYMPRFTLPEIGYKMPELTFTSKLRKKTIPSRKGQSERHAAEEVNEDEPLEDHAVVENDVADESVILEELKQDIKKEVDSESDPELVTILEALAQNRGAVEPATSGGIEGTTGHMRKTHEIKQETESL